jgi:hypothetical protein
MKFSLVTLATTAVKALAAPAPAAPVTPVPSTPGEFHITMSAAGPEATATPNDNNEPNEERDVERSMHKRWYGSGGYIACGNQWWEHGEKRVTIHWTGITDQPRYLGLLTQTTANTLSLNNWAGWRSDVQQWQADWSFPASETAGQIAVWQQWFGITCAW